MSPFSLFDWKRARSLQAVALLLLATPLPDLAAQAVEPAFVENRGQWPESLRFGSRQHGITTWYAQDGIHLLLEQPPEGWDRGLIRHGSVSRGRDRAEASRSMGQETLNGHSLFLRPLRRSSQSRLEATGGLSGLRHQHGKVAVVEIPRRQGLRYRGIWPGVDLRFGHRQGKLEYQLDIARGVALRGITFELEGAERLRLGAEGELRARTSLGTLVQSRPRAFVAEGAGAERELRARFVLLGGTRFGFEVDGWNGERDLRIDPGFSWAGYVGGTAYDGFNAVCTTPGGDLVSVGFSFSWNYPVTPGAFQTKNKGWSDVVVVKRSARGRKLEWVSYLGGSHRESAFAVACDSKGHVVLGGWTSSKDYPLGSKPLQGKYGGGPTDAFLSKLDVTGKTLHFSAYLGGSKGDVLYSLQLDNKDRVYLCGETSSPNFRTTSKSFSTAARGKLDAFVCQTDALGRQFLFSGRTGGSGNDGATSLALDEKRGRLFVCGQTGSANFPVSKTAYGKSLGGGLLSGDVFVMTLPLQGTSLLAATYLGGRGDETPWGIDVDPQGNPVLAGQTFSRLFPTTKGVVMPTARGLGDAFVSRMSPMLNALLMSTFFGGGLPDGALGVDVEEDGKIRISGSSFSNGSYLTMPFPTTAGAFANRHGGGEDAFVVRLDARGRLPLYSSLFGGSGNEWFYTDANHKGPLMPIAGVTFSSNFPVSKNGARYGGFGDGVLAYLDPLPRGAWLGGRATATCSGEPTLLPATWPKAGTPNFLLLAGRAPIRRPGILLIGTASSKPVIFAGAEIWLNLGRPALPVVLMSNQLGESMVRLALPPRKGLVASLQLFWMESAKCSRPIAATRYLRLALQ